MSTAERHCHRRLHLLASIPLVGSLGCAYLPAPLQPARSGLHVVTAPDPSQEERYCAWYGDSDGQTLYAGLSPFWWAMRRADGDPRADEAVPGPQWVGRFDLAGETWEEPLDVAPEGVEPRSGTWDVLATGDGVYFTAFFETSGRVDPESGQSVAFEAAGPGLNELAPGPEGRVLASRYGSGEQGRGNGELLTLEPDGRIARRWPMPAPLGFFVAPKTPAWSPLRDRLVATTDLLPEFEGGDLRHDAYELALDEEPAWAIQSDPELQFVAVTASGVEYRVESHAGQGLLLRRLRPPGVEPEDQQIVLDPDFPADLDFAQDLKVMADGRLVVTRWSGRIHVVDPASGRVATAKLPGLEKGGLYYSAVIREGRLCATYCAGVTVVCTDAP